MSSRISLATVWLDGCSGCHMSFLDLDERLLELGQRVDLVYSPLVDRKEYPEVVDVALVEGAVASDEDLAKVRLIRARTRTLVALGDCAVTGNVPSMRNPFGLDAVFARAYVEHATTQAQAPSRELPCLLEKVVPVHEAVRVDVVVPGCPPSADLIWLALNELLAGRLPELEGEVRFG